MAAVLFNKYIWRRTVKVTYHMPSPGRRSPFWSDWSRDMKYFNLTIFNRQHLPHSKYFSSILCGIMFQINIAFSFYRCKIFQRDLIREFDGSFRSPPLPKGSIDINLSKIQCLYIVFSLVHHLNNYTYGLKISLCVYYALLSVGWYLFDTDIDGCTEASALYGCIAAWFLVAVRQCLFCYGRHSGVYIPLVWQ